MNPVYFCSSLISPELIEFEITIYLRHDSLLVFGSNTNAEMKVKVGTHQ